MVVESTLDGETVWTLNRRKDSGVYEKEEQFKPSNMVVAPNGDIYVADGLRPELRSPIQPQARADPTLGGQRQ